MKDRIRQIRKNAGLNQTEFGSRIGVNQSSVAGYENGARFPLDAVLLAIEKEFRINGTWLRTGEGEMYRDLTEEEELEQWLGRIQFGAINGNKAAIIKQKLLVAFSHIENDATWEDLYRIFKEIADRPL